MLALAHSVLLDIDWLGGFLKSRSELHGAVVVCIGDDHDTPAVFDASGGNL
jgi:hypothetical protein